MFKVIDETISGKMLRTEVEFFKDGHSVHTANWCGSSTSLKDEDPRGFWACSDGCHFGAFLDAVVEDVRNNREDYCRKFAKKSVYDGACPVCYVSDWETIFKSLLSYYDDILIDGISIKGIGVMPKDETLKTSKKVTSKPEETETKFTFAPIIKKERTKISLT